MSGYNLHSAFCIVFLLFALCKAFNTHKISMKNSVNNVKTVAGVVLVFLIVFASFKLIAWLLHLILN